MSVTILAIESSCDDTSAAVLRDGRVLSNVTASQAVHMRYGGVVPELASRAHQQNIIPVVDKALADAGISPNGKPADGGADALSAVAFTRGPGLMGSLLVGTSFAKSYALALGLPIIDVNHLQAHVSAHFIIADDTRNPPFPFLCLLVSGGNSQILKVESYTTMTIIGQTIDDAAGEAFDKCAKVLGLGYPGGPIVDQLAKSGNPQAFKFAKPQISGYNYSFSGLKTSFLYALRDNLSQNPKFIDENKEDLCASLQHTVVQILMEKLLRAARDLKIKHIALAGGVSANTGLRAAFEKITDMGLTPYVPQFSYTTDNAAMVASAAYRKYQVGDFASQEVAPYARVAV